MFERLEEEPLEYAVDAFVSGGRTIRGRLRWESASKARFEILEDRVGADDGPSGDGETAQSPPDREAVVDQIHKLARVVRQSQQARLSRWRA